MKLLAGLVLVGAFVAGVIYGVLDVVAAHQPERVTVARCELMESAAYRCADHVYELHEACGRGKP